MANRRGNRPSGAWNRRAGKAAMSGPTSSRKSSVLSLASRRTGHRQQATGHDLTRRQFLKTTGVAAAGVGAAAMGLGGVAHAALDVTTIYCGSKEVTITTPDAFLHDAAGNDLGWGLDPIEDFTVSKSVDFYNMANTPGHPLYPFMPFQKQQGISLISGYGPYWGGMWRIYRDVINDLDDVPRPADFPGEEIAFVEDDTYTVEFTVPVSYVMENVSKPKVLEELRWYFPWNADAVLDEINSSLRDPPVTEYKVRGWFIQGYPGKELIIVSRGHSDSIFTLSTSNLYYRKLAFYLHLQGYNVLFYDYTARGVSDGWNTMGDHTPKTHPAMPELNETYETGNAPNIFYMVHQLAGEAYPDAGHTMRYKPPTGPVVENGSLISSANIPVVLYGMSHGTSISGLAMALNFPPSLEEDLPAFRTELEGELNLKGYIEAGGLTSARYSIHDFQIPEYIIGASAIMMGWGMLAQDYYDVNWPSEILASAHKWPAYLGLHGTRDGIFVLEGCVETFNRVNGTKDVVIVDGGHGASLYPSGGPDNFAYVFRHIAQFCRRAFESSAQDNSTTTVQQEVCRAPILGQAGPAAEGWLESEIKRLSQQQ